MSAKTVTYICCDRCGEDGGERPGIEWATFNTPFHKHPSSKNTKQRRRTLHLCPSCTAQFDEWIKENRG